MNIKYITSILLLQAVLAGTAQDLSTEITVDRTVVTELPVAAPLSSVFPSMPADNGNKFSVKPVQYTQWTEFQPAASTFNTPLFTGFTPAPGYRGYILGGYFPAYNAVAAAGYRFIDTKDSQLGASVRFNGYSYKYQGNKTADNTFSAQIDGSHRLASVDVFAAEIGYRHAGLKNAGAKQGISDIRASAGLYRQDKYRLRLGFDCFGLEDAVPVSTGGNYSGKPRDMHFSAEGAYAIALGDATDFDFGVKGDVLNRKDVEDVLTETGDYSFTSYIVALNPALRFASDNFKARVGVNVSIAGKTSSGKFCVAPDVTLAWTPSGIVDVYGRFGGGRDVRGLRWQYQVSPFSLSPEAESITNSPIDSRVGLNLRPIGGLHVGLFAGYSSWKKVSVLQRFNALQGPGNFVRMPANYHVTDFEGWNYGFEASYEVSGLGRIHAGATFYSKGDPTMGDRAKTVADAGLTVHPIERLTVDVSYRLRASRRYLSYFDSFSSTDGIDTLLENAGLGNVSDLCIGGNYAVTPQFSVFLQLENILGRRYQIIPDLYSKAFHGMFGASYIF